MKYSAFIDASTQRCLVAISLDGQLLWSQELSHGHQNSRELVSALREGLTRLGLEAKDLTYLGLGAGPGSYTGLRVAAAVVKGLALPLGLPIVPVCSLMGLVPDEDSEHFAAIMDAKISGAYLLLGQCIGGKFIFEAEPSVVPLSQLAARIKVGALLVVPELARFKDKVEVAHPDMGWRWLERGMDPAFFAEETYRRFEAGQTVQVGELELMYMRQAQAEIERLSKVEQPVGLA